MTRRVSGLPSSKAIHMMRLRKDPIVSMIVGEVNHKLQDSSARVSNDPRPCLFLVIQQDCFTEA